MVILSSSATIVGDYIDTERLPISVYCMKVSHTRNIRWLFIQTVERL